MKYFLINVVADHGEKSFCKLPMWLSQNARNPPTINPIENVMLPGEIRGKNTEKGRVVYRTESKRIPKIVLKMDGTEVTFLLFGQNILIFILLNRPLDEAVYGELLERIAEFPSHPGRLFALPIEFAQDTPIGTPSRSIGAQSMGAPYITVSSQIDLPYILKDDDVFHKLSTQISPRNALQQKDERVWLAVENSDVLLGNDLDDKRKKLRQSEVFNKEIKARCKKLKFAFRTQKPLD